MQLFSDKMDIEDCSCCSLSDNDVNPHDGAMFTEFESFKSERDNHYRILRGSLKIQGWVYQEAISAQGLTVPYQACSKVDRRFPITKST